MKFSTAIERCLKNNLTKTQSRMIIQYFGSILRHIEKFFKYLLLVIKTVFLSFLTQN